MNGREIFRNVVTFHKILSKTEKKIENPETTKQREKDRKWQEFLVNNTSSLI